MNTVPLLSSIPLDLMIVSAAGGVTGQTPLVLVQRKSDGYYWNGTSSFVVGVTQIPMTEVDSVNQPGLYRVLFNSQGGDTTTNVYVAFYSNANPLYPGNATDEFVFSNQTVDVNTLSIAQAVASKILLNPAVPIDSADIASQTTLLVTKAEVEDIQARMATQASLSAFATATTTTLGQILSAIQPAQGSSMITFNVTDQSNLPVPGVYITLKNTTSAITVAVGYTDINGQLVLGLPGVYGNPAVFNVLFYKPFYTFGAQPYVLTVTGDQTVAVSSVSFQPTPALPGTCACYCYMVDATSAPVVGELLRAKLVSNFPFTPGTGVLATKTEVEAFSDSSGYVQLNLIQGATYELSAPALYVTLTNFLIPAVASLDLSTQLFRNS